MNLESPPLWPVSFVLLFLVLATCADLDREFDTFHISLRNDPKGFDPAYSTDFGTGQVCALVFDNLVQFGHGTSIEPGIAKSWRISDDGLRYRFQLHKGFHFTNGQEITTETVKASILRILNPSTGSFRAWLFKPIEGANSYASGQSDDVSGIRILGRYTLELRLERPYAPFLSFLAMPAAAIVPVDLITESSSAFNKNPVGSGPWVLEEWEHASKIVFRANPDYFYESPEVSRLQIKILPEIFSNIAEFEIGRLDLMEVPQSEFHRWVHTENRWNIHMKPELNLYYIGLNCAKPPFDNVKVRQAMNMAIDVDNIINNLLNGAAVESHGPIPPGLPAYDSTRQAYEYNPGKARQLLADAGYENGFTVELWQSQNSEYNELSEAFQAYYKEIGVDVKIVMTDFNLMLDAIRQGQPDMYYLNWWADYPDAENFLFPLFHSSQARQRNRYVNPGVDSLIEANQLISDRNKREKVAGKIERQIIRDAPYVFLFHEITYEATQPWVEGYEPSIVFSARKFLNIRLDHQE